MMNYGGDYAGFWRRFFAYMIDGIIIVVLGIVCYLLFGADMPDDSDIADRMAVFAGSQTPLMVLYYAYYAILTASPLRGTFGKFVLDAAVVDGDGNTISVLRGLWREMMKIPSAMIFYIGFIMAAFTAEKRGLHDYLSGTFVVKASESPAETTGSGVASKVMNYGTAAALCAMLIWSISVENKMMDAYAEHIRVAVAESKSKDAESARLTDAHESVRQVHGERDFSAVVMLAEKVEEHAVSKQKFPSQFLDLGVSRGDVLEQGVREVSVGKNGVLHVSYESNSSVGDAKLVMAPFVDESGHIQWTCRSMQLSDSDLPEICGE